MTGCVKNQAFNCRNGTFIEISVMCFTCPPTFLGLDGCALSTSIPLQFEIISCTDNCILARALTRLGPQIIACSEVSSFWTCFNDVEGTVDLTLDIGIAIGVNGTCTNFSSMISTNALWIQFVVRKDLPQEWDISEPYPCVQESHLYKKYGFALYDDPSYPCSFCFLGRALPLCS